MIEKAYLAANTPFGFKNNFGAGLQGKYVYVIKGGSGVGKSTLMKSLLKDVSSAERITIVPCSSDSHSLDAVIMHDRGIAMVDGTAPHLYEPSAYGVNGEIFDLGKYINKAKIAERGDEILENIRRKSVLYSLMYTHLASARRALDNINLIYGDSFADEINELTEELLKTFIIGADDVDYPIFGYGEYFTDNGYAPDTDITCNRVTVGIKAKSIYFALKCIENIALYMDSVGMKYDKYMSALYPDMPIALGLKNVIVMATDGILDYEYTIYGNAAEKNDYLVHLIEERSVYSAEIARAAEYFVEAGLCHKKIENCYFGAMQFPRMEKDKAKLLQRIFGSND